MIYRYLLLAAVLAITATSAQASADADFQAARDAIQKGQSARFLKIAENFPADHALAPYIRFWELKNRKAPETALRAYIDQNPDSHLSNRLRIDLAREFGLRGNWPAFLETFASIVAPDQELRCFELSARQAIGDPPTRAAADSAGIALWRTARDLPSSCDGPFSNLAQRGLLSLEDRLARLRLALDDGNLRLVRELDARLPSEARMTANALTLAQSKPESLVAAAEMPRAQREVALYALTQVAKTAPEQAAELWLRHQDQYSQAERDYGWGQIGMHGARRHDERAMEWFGRAENLTSELQNTWKVRAALRAGQWGEVNRSIDAMPETLRNEAVWRYWKARALKALNATYPANVLFAKLSREIHYYGLLAEEELPAKLETRPFDYKVTPNDLKQAESHAGLRRALLLRELGDHGNAVQEWNWALRGMTDRALLAAAELARRDNWYDRAIATADRTREEHDFDLRYIAPYRDLASAYARQNELDEAWIYGLMRQESRFIEHAKSRVGAQGLMQIMPATAKWISSKMGLEKNTHAGVVKPETNIRFGTFYLKHVYDSLGQSPVLATAGYNAGPGRARRWQAPTALEGAIYVESIPFYETREYVKKVLANAMFYRKLFGGEAPPLKERLGVIPPHPNALRASQAGTSDKNRVATSETLQ